MFQMLAQAGRAVRARSALLLAVCTLAAAGCGGGGSEKASLQATWAASPSDYNAPNLLGAQPTAMSFENKTIRQVMRVSAGGTGARVKISNRYGAGALILDAAALARTSGAAGTGAIDATSSVVLKFGGQTSITIPAGQEIWSDIADITVPSNADLSVSVFVSQKMPVTTVHSTAIQQAFIANGNVVSQGSITPIAPNPVSSFWVSGIDVLVPDARGAVVAFGDSITDGFTSTVDGAKRYPDFLARRIAAAPQLSGISVVNAGISGNRLLNDFRAVKALTRFDADVLQMSGVSHVIVLIGINDIGFSNAPIPPLSGQAVTADEIKAGLQTLVTQAKAKGLKVYLGTLLPFEGAPFPYYNAAGEAKRQAVNAWIRANAAGASGFIDFDAALRDPASPTKLQAVLDSGDHLHPNDSGYDAMAKAVDLAIFN